MIFPPPFHTPFLDGRGRVTVPWVAWLSTLSTSQSPVPGPASVTLSGSHAARLAAPGVTEGTLWFETDRRVTYVYASGAWQLAGGEQAAPFAERPADLGADDVGYSFVATDTNILYSWDGAAWLQLTTGSGAGPSVWGPSSANFLWGPVGLGQNNLIWGQAVSGATILWG